MWVKIFISAILLYFIALLQNTFFIYFNVFAAVPNFVFIFFFFLVFFSKKKDYYETIFYSLIAGFFLDVFSSFRVGVSIALLLIIGVLIKKVILTLKEKEEKYPLIYFIAIFTSSFLVYCISLEIYLCILSQCQILLIFDVNFLIEFFYTLFFSTLVFLTCKKFLKNKKDSLQTGLSKNVFQ